MALRTISTKAVKSMLAKAGLRIERNYVVRDAMRHFIDKAQELGVGTVIDVGANAGQFASDLRRGGYDGAIFSFEPIKAAHAACVRAANDDANWHVMPAMALGNQVGTAEIHVSQNLVSSSLMPIKRNSVDAAPQSAFSNKETITVARLDDVAESGWVRPLALKIDTQGFELEVLRGGTSTLQDVVLLQLEMSLVELYEGAPTFSEVYREVEALGFRCISITQGFVDHKRNELLQVDGLFVR